MSTQIPKQKMSIFWTSNVLTITECQSTIWSNLHDVSKYRCFLFPAWAAIALLGLHTNNQPCSSTQTCSNTSGNWTQHTSSFYKHHKHKFIQLWWKSFHFSLQHHQPANLTNFIKCCDAGDFPCNGNHPSLHFRL